MFLGLIPSQIYSKHQKRREDFSRKRKLSFSKLITFILSITSSGKSKGVDSKSGEFFRNARRSGLWPDAKAIHRSSLTKARKKVPWEVFEELHSDAVDLAYEMWPDESYGIDRVADNSAYTYKGMNVYGFDGSKFMLPATPELREEFDPGSGLENEGRGHYPQCLVNVAYDVFRRLPVAQTVVGINGSEREEAKKLICKIPPGNLLMFDRGYPSFEFFKYLNENYEGFYLFRSPASGSFKAVAEFVKSKKKEDVIWLKPPVSYLSKYNSTSTAQERKAVSPLELRVVRLQGPDGKLSVILTNLMNKKKFPREEIIKLYFRRWEIESFYRDEKVYLGVDTFHSRTSNGIRQELFAALVMSVIARIMMVIALPPSPSTAFFPAPQEQNQDGENLESKSEVEVTVTIPLPQFKNAVMTLAAEAAILTPDNAELAVEIFKEVITEIRRVKYYRPITPQPSKPRINKHPPNKWTERKSKRKKRGCNA
jgi:hypothetical protein